MCVTSETRHLDRLGQLSEFEQDINTDSHSARNRAQVAQQSTAEAGEKTPQSKGQITQQDGGVNVRCYGAVTQVMESATCDR